MVAVVSFSAAMIAPSNAIQIMFMVPVANISNIMAQQHPRQ